MDTVHRQMVGFSRVSRVRVKISVRIRVRFSFSGAPKGRAAEVNARPQQGDQNFCYTQVRTDVPYT